MSLKYTKLLQFRIILALKNGDGNIRVFIKAKKAYIRRSIFQKLMLNSVKTPIISYGMAYTMITEETVI